MTHPTAPLAFRIARIATLACACTLGAAGGARAAGDTPAAAPKVQFLPGWEQAARPLTFEGIGMHTSRTKWRAPVILPPGNYRVITREDGAPHLVDGQRFAMDSGSFTEVYLLIDPSVHSPEALDERFIAGLSPQPGGNVR